MSKIKSTRKSNVEQTIKKSVLSAVVVVTFIAYVIHDRLTSSTSTVLNQASAGNPSDSNQTNNVPQPTPAIAANATYRDGQYSGNVADAYYGTVQVKAIIQGGRIADVQFLDYPRDRRTSQMINQQATPWLTQEAVQAQNAQVDLISGATLTSQAFVESLQTALSQAQR